MARNSNNNDRGGGKVDRLLRVNELIKRELAGLLERYPVPGLSGVLVSITEVNCSVDLRNAGVYVSIFGCKGHSVEEQVLKHLAKCRPDWQHRLAVTLGFKRTPVLSFELDGRQAAGDRVLELLRETEAETQAQSGEEIP